MGSKSNLKADIHRIRSFIIERPILNIVLRVLFIYNFCATICYPLILWIIFKIYAPDLTLTINESEHYFTVFRKILAIYLTFFYLFLFLRIKWIDRLFGIEPESHEE